MENFDFGGEIAWRPSPQQIADSNLLAFMRRRPGDTFGISTLSPGHLVLSWGMATATTGKKSQIFAAPVTVSGH